jgi:nucleotide-binding universal stress UspA family protein
VSIFPARILLPTDGSKEAELAARSAVGLTKTTASGLRVLNVEGRRDVLDEQVR